MDKRVRWGIAGPGRMAATMAAEFAHSPSNQLVAVASRDHGRAMDFAAEHRIGTVPRREASVVIAASAAHRGPAFAAAREAIDRIKAQVPIWKREVDVTPAGVDARWVDGTPVEPA